MSKLLTEEGLLSHSSCTNHMFSNLHHLSKTNVLNISDYILNKIKTLELLLYATLQAQKSRAIWARRSPVVGRNLLNNNKYNIETTITTCSKILLRPLLIVFSD